MENNKQVQRVAAKAVILSENGILALQPSGIDPNKKWHIPGGIRDNIDEPLIETATREISEETGIDLTGLPYKVIKIGEWSVVDKGENCKILGVFFLFQLPHRPELQLSQEHSGSAWLNLNNYQDYEINQDLEEAVKIVFLTK